MDSRLLDRLKSAGIKHNAQDVVGICESSDGEIVFLETGNSNAGLEHILTKHEGDFVRRGVAQTQIPDIIMEAVQQDNIVGYQRNRPIYEVVFNKVTQHVAITIGKNGFVVGANPATI